MSIHLKYIYTILRDLVASSRSFSWFHFILPFRFW